jgi:hypothetical protein
MRGTMTDTSLKLLVAALCFGLVAACSTGPQGVRIVNGGTSAIPAKEGAKIRNFAAGEIGPAVIGKNFQYTRKDSSGIVTYNADGSLTIQDDQKGSLIGKWTASGEQYCEAYGPSLPQECGVFKYTGDAYFAANSRLVELKV